MIVFIKLFIDNRVVSIYLQPFVFKVTAILNAACNRTLVNIQP